ncbi:hypothetical protein QP185_02255 [Sphingomonas aerolata]|uniref:hypothetical protein n=1 Tax=Sphingomonas aerolata TaxID=185951 RepID=UPI002FE1ECEC
MDRAVEFPPEDALMGWLWLGIIAVGAFALLAVLRVDRLLWSMVAAALMLGAAGYALQGEPELAGHPVVTGTTITPDDGSMIELRDKMLERYTGAAAYLVAADAMTRIGERRAAVKVLLGGIRVAPKSLVLWTGLANALAAHDGDQVRAAGAVRVPAGDADRTAPPGAALLPWPRLCPVGQFRGGTTLLGAGARTNAEKRVLSRRDRGPPRAARSGHGSTGRRTGELGTDAKRDPDRPARCRGSWVPFRAAKGLTGRGRSCPGARRS